MGHLTAGSSQDHHPEKNHSEVWKMSRCCFPVGKRGQTLLVAEIAHTKAQRRGSTQGMERWREIKARSEKYKALNGRLWSLALFRGQWGARERLSVREGLGRAGIILGLFSVPWAG